MDEHEAKLLARRKRARERRRAKRWRAKYEGDIAHGAALDRRAYEVKEEFGRWLNGHAWSWYVTLTFAVWIHPEQAGKRFREWTRRIERAVGDDLTWARALEFQRRGVVHFHALLYFRRADLPYAMARASWANVTGGFAWIERYNPERGAAAYLGKYLVKGGEVDCGGPWWTPRSSDEAGVHGGNPGARDGVRPGVA